MKPIEECWRDRMKTRALRLTVKRGALTIDRLHEVSGERASRVRQFVIRPGGDPAEEQVTVLFVRLSQTSVDAIAVRLRALPEVIAVRREDE